MKQNFPQLFFLLLVLLVSAAFFGLIGGFLMAVFWAIVFAILFSSLYERLKIRFKGKRNLSAAITLLFIILLVIIPLSIIGLVVIEEAADYYQKVNKGEFDIQDIINQIQASLPMGGEFLEKYGLSLERLQENVQNIFAEGTRIVAGRAVGLTQNLFGFLVNFSLMLYILYFFLRDGKKLVQELVWVLPIGDEQEWTLLRRFESVARATVKGSLLVALVQGAIGGLLFWIVGIPAAFLWGILMVLMSLLPIGSALIWFPAAVILLIQGEIGRGIAVILVGAFLIGLVDNLLRPRLVGQDTKMPDYLILLSTLGGLAWFGLSGFVIGPIIAALFVTCWQMLGKEYGRPHDEVVTESVEEKNEKFKELEEVSEQEEEIEDKDVS
ncbi:MAG: AI-2E family transporter [Bacteroidota bacterium]